MPLVSATTALSAERFDDQWVPGDPSGVVDLRDVTAVLPAGLVRLCCAVVQHQAVGGGHVEVLGPTEWPVANYMSRMGLAVFLNERDVRHDLPPTAEDDASDHAAVRSFTTDLDHAYKVCELLYRLAENAGFPAGACDTLYDCLYELFDNAVTHARTDVGLAAAQVFTHAEGGHSVDFAIGDVGIGIKRSLDPAYRSDSDVAAISKAIAPRISSVDDRRGIGLSNLAKWIGRAGGHVRIRSGLAEVDVKTAGAGHAKVLPESRTHGTYLQGVVVSASMPC